MIFKIKVKVIVYAEDEEDTRYMVPGESCGIIGEEIILPLRDINGQTLTVEAPDNFTVAQLWDRIDDILYGNSGESDIFGSVLNFVKEYNKVRKYLCFNGLRYEVCRPEKTIASCLEHMGIPADQVQVQLLVSADAGEVYRDDGIRYFFNSNEATRHHEAHVHVDVRHEREGSYSLIDFRKLSGDIKSRDERKVVATIKDKQIEFLEYWNTLTNGMRVDINQALGILNY